MKEDVENLPEKEEVVVWVQLTHQQRSYYKALYSNQVSTPPMPPPPPPPLTSPLQPTVTIPSDHLPHCYRTGQHRNPLPAGPYLLPVGLAS